MVQKDPISTSQQSKFHQRILAADPIAFAELCEVALPMLSLFLQAQFPQQNPHLCDTTAVDCLLAYRGRPQQYDPDKLALFAYLRMAVRRDMLNAIDSRQRRTRHLTDIDHPDMQTQLAVESEMSETMVLDDWLVEYTQLSRTEIQNRVAELMTDEELQALWLMLDGVRDSDRYVQVLGITHLDKPAQRRAVKQVKDRIKKRLRRLGQKLE